jgi:hypothetical protein
MSSSKKFDLSRDFAAGVYLSEAQNPIPAPTPLHTVYVFTVYVFIHTGKGGGGRVEPERRLKGQQFTKLGRNTNMIDCISSL